MSLCSLAEMSVSLNQDTWNSISSSTRHYWALALKHFSIIIFSQWQSYSLLRYTRQQVCHLISIKQNKIAHITKSKQCIIVSAWVHNDKHSILALINSSIESGFQCLNNLLKDHRLVNSHKIQVLYFKKCVNRRIPLWSIKEESKRSSKAKVQIIARTLLLENR